MQGVYLNIKIMKNTTIPTTTQIKASLIRGEYNVIRIEEKKINSLGWRVQEVTTEQFTHEQKQRFLSKDTLRFFRNLGGKESVKTGSYQKLDCTINISTSPCGKERKTTYFF